MVARHDMAFLHGLKMRFMFTTHFGCLYNMPVLLTETDKKMNKNEVPSEYQQPKV